MTRLEKLLKKWGVSSAAFKQQRVCVDIGSAVTKVIVDGTFFMQPTCLIQHQATSSVLAIGEKALALRSALPQGATVIYPVQYGKVVNTGALEQYLQVLLAPYLRRDISSFIFSPKISCASLHAQQSSQATACSQLFQHWTRRTTLHHMAAATWQLVHHSHPGITRSCVIDLGAMTSKFFILHEGKSVATHLTEGGGDQLTKDIQQILRQEYQCDVGWFAAEQFKKTLLSFSPTVTAPANKQQLVHGKHIFTSLPVSQVVESKKFLPALDDYLQRMTDGFAQVCQAAPPEFVAEIQRVGIFVSGGGSQLSGLYAALEKKLHVKVLHSPTPQRDVVQGLWML